MIPKQRRINVVFADPNPPAMTIFVDAVPGAQECFKATQVSYEFVYSSRVDRLVKVACTRR